MRPVGAVERADKIPMKINKLHFAQLTASAAITCALAITGCANTTPKKSQLGALNNRSNLDESARANHNSLLDLSVYETNDVISS